jgi:glyoxylase-like metal-dependent hydrolase (beta-lactamase superfamily II)
MTIKIDTFVLGPIENNTYLITDSDTRKAAIIDPSIPSREMLDSIRGNGLMLTHILITHAHFDHIGGAAWLKKQLNDEPRVYLHHSDLQLWLDGGGARDFGLNFDSGRNPDVILGDDEQLKIGGLKCDMLRTPGHTPGHVTFYFPHSAAAFCGDLIFFHSVGRTDLSYSSQDYLIRSITGKIFTLPEETVLYPGHGPTTTVGEEKANNPFLNNG